MTFPWKLNSKQPSTNTGTYEAMDYQIPQRNNVKNRLKGHGGNAYLSFFQIVFFTFTGRYFDGGHNQ